MDKMQDYKTKVMRYYLNNNKIINNGISSLLIKFANECSYYGSTFRYNRELLNMYRTDSWTHYMPELYRERDLRVYFPPSFLYQLHDEETTNYYVSFGNMTAKIKKVNRQFLQLVEQRKESLCQDIIDARNIIMFSKHQNICNDVCKVIYSFM